MPGPPANRGWMWFFAILAVLAVVFITVLVRFNLAQQLTPEKLQEARALWERNGPPNYDIAYTEQGRVSAKYEVRVRNGRVVYAEPDERPLAQKRIYYGMQALFGFVAQFLKEDSQPGRPRPFTIATFDSRDGHLIHYVRALRGTSERLEIKVEYRAVTDETGGLAPPDLGR